MDKSGVIAAWFQDQGHLLLLDRRSLCPASTPYPHRVSGDWRLVAWCPVETLEEDQVELVSETTICPWPPLHPHRMPLLIGPITRPIRFQVFEIRQLVSDELISRSAAVVCDPSLTPSNATAWWVVACLANHNALNDGMFGPAIYIEHQMIVRNDGESMLRNVIVSARYAAPQMLGLTTYLVVPVTEDLIGPAIFTEYKSNHLGPTVDFVFESRNDGTTQPVIALRARHNVDLREVISGLECIVLRRNAMAFGFSDLWRAPLALDKVEFAVDQATFALPEPIYYGDVVGIMCRDQTFELADHLRGSSDNPIDRWDQWSIVLFVRREDFMSPSNEDTALIHSGRLDRLREAITAAELDSSIDQYLRTIKRAVAHSLRRTAMATSYLIQGNLGCQARDEVDRLTTDNENVHLENFAFAAAIPKRMEALLDKRQALDRPWRRINQDVEDAILIACYAEIAGLRDVHGCAQAEKILNEPGIIQALMHVATRSAALSCWKEAMSR